METLLLKEFTQSVISFDSLRKEINMLLTMAGCSNVFVISLLPLGIRLMTVTNFTGFFVA